MTLNEYRADPTLTSAAQKTLNSKPMQVMLSVLESELPSNRALPPLGTDSNSFIYAYGVEIGYRQAIAVLKMMSSGIEVREEVESTFSETNNEVSDE